MLNLSGHQQGEEGSAWGPQHRVLLVWVLGAELPMGPSRPGEGKEGTKELRLRIFRDSLMSSVPCDAPCWQGCHGRSCHNPFPGVGSPGAAVLLFQGVPVLSALCLDPTGAQQNQPLGQPRGWFL